MHLPRTMVTHAVANYAYDIEQLDLRRCALEEVQCMDGSSFVIYFSDYDYEIICVDGLTAFEYNPHTDFLIDQEN